MFYNPFQPDTNDYKILIQNMGKDVLINSVPQKVLMQMDNLNKQLALRTIQSLSPLSCGQLVETNGLKYLITSEIPEKRHDLTVYKGVIRYCQHTFKILLDCDLYIFDAFADSNINTINNGDTIILPDGMMYLTVQDNTNTRRIVRDKRIIKFGKAWKCVGHDFTQKGLIKISFQEVQISNSDNMVDEVADATACTYSITITNGENANILEGDRLQLQAKVMLNGYEVQRNVVWSSSDTTIATIDSSGIITGKVSGNVVITACIESTPTIKDTISITVNSLPSDNYSISISGNTSVTYGMTSTYTATVLNNGVATTGKVVTWGIRNEDGTTTPYGTIKSFTDTTCVVQIANNQNYIGKYVVLTSTLSTDVNIFTEYRIKVKGLF